MMTGILKTLQECAMMCEQTAEHLMESPDALMRKHQIKFLRDCSNVCELCSKLITRNSIFTKSICEYCAFVCEYCGNECLRHHDRESQMCGKMCLACAKECRSFAMAA